MHRNESSGHRVHWVLPGQSGNMEPPLGEGILSMRMSARAINVVCLLVGIPSTSIASDFILTIHRQYSDANCTSGYLAVNGTIQAYTLERPWAGNQPAISSIPTGSYPGILRYDHTDQWRIELTGVPGRDHVEIHTGNTPDDTEGCILVGKELGDDLCSIKSGTSKPAYQDLKNAFYGTPNPVSTPDKTITVNVEGMTQ